MVTTSLNRSVIHFDEIMKEFVYFLPKSCKHKARLVAKRYTQTYGIDYLEIFTPVVKMNTLRVILSLAIIQEWSLKRFDVKDVFCGALLEEVYMDPPLGFTPKKANGAN